MRSFSFRLYPIECICLGIRVCVGLTRSHQFDYFGFIRYNHMFVIFRLRVSMDIYSLRACMCRAALMKCTDSYLFRCIIWMALPERNTKSTNYIFTHLAWVARFFSLYFHKRFRLRFCSLVGDENNGKLIVRKEWNNWCFRFVAGCLCVRVRAFRVHILMIWIFR